MSIWNMVNSGLNYAEETINFGPRNLQIEDTGNLYETVTLASLENSNDTVSVRPLVNGVVKDNQLFVSVDRTLKVFDTLSCENLCIDLVFDCVVDAFCVVEEFFLVSLRNGTVEVVSKAQKASIFSTRVVEEHFLEGDQTFVACFVEDNNKSFIVVSKMGKIVRLATESSVTNFTLSELRDLQMEVTLASFDDPYLLLDGTKMHLYNVSADKLVTTRSPNLRKLCSFNSMFVGLLATSKLVRICCRSLVVFEIKTDLHFDDFTTIPDFEETSHILALTRNIDGSSHITRITYPENETIFSLKTCANLHILTPETIDNNTFLIKHHENSLHVLEIYKSAPEKRLLKLLELQNFDEAEIFAKTYDLDLNIVRKARVQVIVDQALCSTNDIDTLFTILNEINDTLFTLKCCVEVHYWCEDIRDVQRVLEYGCANLQSKSLKNEEISSLYNLLSNVLLRFGTFCLLTRSKRVELDLKEWQEFSQCDLIAMVVDKLRNFKTEESIILYGQLFNASLTVVTDEHVHEILNILNTMPMNVYEPFLYTFVPVTLTHLPYTLPVFVEWLIKKTFSIERKLPFQFPEKAIEFTDVFLKLFSNVRDNGGLRAILGLLQVLKNLQLVKNNFGINVPLSESFKGPKYFVNELCRINMEESIFDNLLQNFLHKYMIEHNLAHDDILLDKIVSVVKYEEKYWAQVVPYVLRTMGSVEIKLKAILILIEASDFPWSEMLTDICVDALTYSHPLVETIRMQLLIMPVFVVLKKYDLFHTKINFRTSLEFIVNRIIREGRPTMVDDIYCICKNGASRRMANRTLLLHHVKRGEIPQALQVIDRNDENEALTCCKELFSFIAGGIENEFNYPNLHTNCFAILKPIYARLSKYHETAPIFLDDKYETLTNMYYLREKFHTNVNYHEFADPKVRKDLFDDLLVNLVDELNDGTIDLAETVKSCNSLATYCAQDKDAALIDLCVKIGEFDSILKLSEILYDESTNSEHLSLAAVLLLQYMGSNSFNLAEMTMNNFNETFMPTNVTVDSDKFVQGLKLAERIAAKAILNANGDLGACAEVYRWVQAGFELMTDRKCKNWRGIFKEFVYTDLKPAPYNTFDALRKVFSVYVGLAQGRFVPNCRYLTHFEGLEVSMGEFVQEVKFLPQTVQNLITHGQLLTARKLMLRLTAGLVYFPDVDAGVVEDLRQIVSSCTKQLIQQVLVGREIDGDLAYYLLLTLDLKDALVIIKKILMAVRRDAKKFATVAQLGVRLMNTLHMTSGKEKLEHVILQCKWWRTLKNCNVPYEEFFQINPDQLMERLTHCDAFDLEVLQQFCRDFNLELQKYYVLHLRTILMNWKPDYVVKVEINKARTLIVNSTEAELYEKCRKIISNVNDPLVIIDVLQTLLNQINFYHYEVYACILKLLSSLDFQLENRNRWCLLLTFLKNYTRVSAPNQTEMGLWYAAFPFIQNVDPLSEWRLPFTHTLFTTNMWNIIRPELTLGTYRFWFEAVDVLECLNMDDICSFVVKQVVASGALTRDVTAEWQLQRKHEHLLNEIDTCVQHISDLEKATSAMYHLMNAVPKGADQVYAAYLCYKYALKYKESSQTLDVQRAFVKIESKYLSFSTTHILHSNNLAEETYLRLVSNPSELIDVLYKDERIVNKKELNVPTINKAVDEIGKLHAIDVTQKRFALLESWLSNSANNDLNMSSIFNFNAENVSLDVSSDNLKRAAYVCSSGKSHIWKQHLVKVGLDDDSQKKNYSFFHKARALKCFCDIASDREIREMTNAATKDEFTTLINKMFLISELESLGFNFDINTLDGTRKNKLIQKLSQNIESNIKLIASICVTYKIYDLRYWEVILNTANQCNMVNELKEYVQFLQECSSCTHRKFYVDSWQKITDHMLRSLRSQSEKEVTDCCVEYIRTIQKCPVLLRLSFRNAIDKFLEVKRPEFAAILLLYVDDETVVKRVVSGRKDLLERINRLEGFGICGVSSTIDFCNSLMC